MTDGTELHTGMTDGRAGDRLREAREAQGLSLGDVAGTLLIQEKYLDAIERMYAGGVPRGVLNGFLRNYAGHLGLPANDVVREFNEQCGAVSEAPKIEAIVAANERTRSTLRAAFVGFSVAIGLVLAGGLGFAVYDDLSSREPVEVAEPVNGARTSLFAEAGTDEIAAQLPLTLTAVRQGWLEVRGADGTIFRSRTMAEGEVYHPRVGAGWTVSARDGSGFVWRVGDVEIGPLSETASAVYALSIDSVAQSAAEIATPALAAVSERKPSR